MEPAADNRRQHERVGVAFSLVVKDGDRRVGIISDISKGGMRVRLEIDADVGENIEVRDWTGHKGTDNRTYVLENMVGEEFTLTISYMMVSWGVLKAKLIRVIRDMNKIFFAMQFTDADPALVEKIMNLVKRRAGL
jgi:hypothetical protein